MSSGVPTISIILPCYNSGGLLAGCLDSIIAQTYEDFELLAIDDGSSDGTAALLDAYAAKDARIRVFHQENRGEACARNRGIEAARGRYIYFTDHDDWLHPQTLEILSYFLTQNDVDGVVCHFRKCTDLYKPQAADINAGEVGFDILEQPLAVYLQKRCFIPIAPWTKLYKRELIGEVRFPEGCHFDDIAFHFCLLAKVKRLGMVDAVLYNFYQNPGSVSHSAITPQKVWSYIENIRVMHKFFRQPAYAVWLRPVRQRVFPKFINVVVGQVRKAGKQGLPQADEMAGVLRSYLFQLWKEKIINLRHFKLRKQWAILKLMLHK